VHLRVHGAPCPRQGERIAAIAKLPELLRKDWREASESRLPLPAAWPIGHIQWLPMFLIFRRLGGKMNYDLLTALVVITALATFALWRHTNRPKFKHLKKKFRKELWESKPIAPKHNKARFEPQHSSEWEAKFFYEFDDLPM